MNVKDLLVDNKADDNHFLLWNKLKIFWNKKIKLFFSSDEKTIKNNQVNDFKKKNSKKWEIKKEIIENNTWLLSMGTILLIWNSIKKASIALIQRSQDDKIDPLHLTMPAWRLDTTLSKWCLAEFFEEMVFWTNECYYQIRKWMRHHGAKQVKRIKRLSLKEMPIRWVNSKKIKLPWTYQVEMYLDQKLIDVCLDVFLLIDKENSTLEFRKIFLFPEREINILADWDWYKRNMYLLDFAELKNNSFIWKKAIYPLYKLKDLEPISKSFKITNTLKGFLDFTAEVQQ